MTPKIIEERKLWKQGYAHVACIDEVGRGALAGPVVAAAVSIDMRFLSSAKDSLAELRMNFPRLKDSKKLSPKRRGEIYTRVVRHSGIRWGIGTVSEKVIDKINIFQATKLAMKRAIANLQKKTSVDFLVIDGNSSLPVSIPQASVVKADEKVFSCALASVIAKVTRDRLMHRYHRLYPQYGFDRHKGYGTRFHLAQLKRLGPCDIHRKTFAPMAYHTHQR